MSFGNRQIKEIISGRQEENSGAVGVRNVPEMVKTSGIEGRKVTDKHADVSLNESNRRTR